MDRVFRALTAATRRDILRRTMAAEASVSQLAAAYDMSFAAIQKHVAVLEGAGLVTKQPHGRERIVRGNPETIRKAQLLLDRYERIWRSRIDRLDELLAAAAARPRTTVLGQDAYPSIDEKAAALGHSVARNHALVDGNKRFALGGLIAFLGS